jgi:hypothetical protein
MPSAMTSGQAMMSSFSSSSVAAARDGGGDLQDGLRRCHDGERLLAAPVPCLHQYADGCSACSPRHHGWNRWAPRIYERSHP